MSLVGGDFVERLPTADKGSYRHSLSRQFLCEPGGLPFRQFNNVLVSAREHDFIHPG